MRTLSENDTLLDWFSPLTKDNGAGMLLTNNFEETAKNYSPEILFALETASKKFNADAVYFRRFPDDDRADMPLLYIFDYSNKALSPNEKKTIHKQMWNGYQVPAYCIVDKSSVFIYDSREKVDDKDNYASEVIKLAEKAKAKTTFDLFADGLFWEEYNKNKHFKFEKSAARDLIKGLKDLYKSFQEKSGIDKHIALKLLVQSILIKYLEERDEKSESGYFAKKYFKTNFQCENFCHTIREGKLLNLLDKLAEDFNGKIFEWENKTEEEKKARTIIQQENIKELADYLDGDNKDKRYVIWRLYSFEHLPIEVISSVYEELLTDSKDIVYTPEMIVSTMVDECMPLSSPPKDFKTKMKFKLGDVSCGSGIFLVKAYKRLVQWWRYEQWKETNKLEKPPLKVLKELLIKNVYGVDIEQDAIRLSVFSLALAVLDEVNLDPPTWEKLKEQKFPDLSEKNILTEDFFKFITNNPPKDFSLIIGNPPFNLPFNNEGKEPNRREYFNKLNKDFGYKSEIKIPDENPALHFLVQAMRLLKDNARLCLVLPSGPLLYQKDLSFKQEFFLKYNLEQVIDFTKLGDKLWNDADVATVVAFVRKSKPDNENVLHLIANRTFSNENRLFLEFDHYDFHWIDKNAVLDNKYIWKANLLGGGRIVQLIERLNDLPTLGDYLEQKTKEGWKYSEGYIVGNKEHYADFIHNKKTVRPKDFKENGIIKFDIENESHFEAPRKAKEIYLKPHILIKENIGEQNIPIVLLEQDAVFCNEIVGIHAPNTDIQKLKAIYEIFKNNNDIYRFHILTTSNRVLVGRVTSISKRDIDNLPFTENTISLNAAEKLVIQDVLSYYSKKNQTILLNDANINKEIDLFSSTFCKTLNSIYQTEKRSFQLFKILDAGKYYALHFEYSSENIQAKKEVVEDLEQYIETHITTRKKESKKTHIQRIMKVFGKDSILLIKPKQLRYWLPSIALRDADEVFAEYYKSRYINAER